MKVSAADLADRYSILTLKCERLPYDAETRREQITYAVACAEAGIDVRDSVDLFEINGLIWDLESGIRQGKEGILGLEEVGRRALKIRDLNRERIAIKNRIAAERGEFQERKGNHASEVASAGDGATVSHEQDQGEQKAYVRKQATR